MDGNHSQSTIIYDIDNNEIYPSKSEGIDNKGFTDSDLSNGHAVQFTSRSPNVTSESEPNGVGISPGSLRRNGTIHDGRTDHRVDVEPKKKDEDDDDEEEEDDGIEMTLDEAEEDAAGGTHSDQPPQQQETKQRRCACCSGLLRCWSRCMKECRETYMEAKECAKEIHRKRLLCRLCSLKTLKKRVPCLQWIPKYNLACLKGDVIAGLTTGLSVLPQGLAYGQIVEIPAVYGLYSSFMGSFVYSVFGTAKDVAVGPSAIVSILTAQYATSRGSPGLIPRNPTYAIILALFTGIIQLAMGILHLGFLFRFISFPVLKAFRAAAGITIFMSRLKKWWGLSVYVPREFLPQLYWTFKRLPETILADFLLGSLCILLLYTFKKLKAMQWKKKFRDLPIHMKIVKKIYWILGAERNIIVVAFAGGVVYAMLQSGIQVSWTKPFQAGVPPFRPPNLTQEVTVPVMMNDTLVNITATIPFWQIASEIGEGFFFVPLVAMFECISIGIGFGKKGNYKIDYDQELIAVGISNILTSFVSGHPVTGAFLRSGINFNAGVKTPAAGILAGAVVLVALAVATPILAYIPTCAMAATIMMGAIDVISFHKFGVIWSTKKSDLIPWLVTFIVSLTWGIEFGVFIGCGISILVVLYSTMMPRIKVKTNGDSSVVTIQPMTGLIYPAVESMSKKLSKLLAQEKSGSTIKLDLSAIVDTDTSVIQCIKVFQDRCKKKGVKLEIRNSQPWVDQLLQRTYLKDVCFPAEDEGARRAFDQDPTEPSQPENQQIIISDRNISTVF